MLLKKCLNVNTMSAYLVFSSLNCSITVGLKIIIEYIATKVEKSFLFDLPLSFREGVVWRFQTASDPIPLIF